jgi:protein SCO1
MNCKELEATLGIEPSSPDLQSGALPLRQVASYVYVSANWLRIGFIDQNNLRCFVQLAVVTKKWCTFAMTNPAENKSRRRNLAIILSLSTVALGGVIAFGLLKPQSQPQVAALPDMCNSRAFAEIGGPFSLVNQDNVAVTERTFLGKPALIYFGFTYCPDVCPMALQTMRLALESAHRQGGTKIAEIQPILISIDPERDTPASLKPYVASQGFPDGLIGLTGTLDQVTAAAKAFKVGFSKSVPKGSPAKDYVMDHSSIIYLMGRDGKLRTFFTGDPDPKVIGKCIASFSKTGL